MVGPDLINHYYSSVVQGGEKYRKYYNEIQEEYINNLFNRYPAAKDRRIVVFHNREASWFNAPWHKPRNTDLGELMPAVERLIKEDYLIVRVGDKNMRKMPVLENIIDLPYSEQYKEIDDLLFIGISKFYFGASSGPYSIAEGFNKPCLIHSLCEDSGGDSEFQHFIFKPIYSFKKRSTLTYHERKTNGICYSTASTYQYRKFFQFMEMNQDFIVLALDYFLKNLSDTSFEDDKKTYLKNSVKLIQCSRDISALPIYPPSISNFSIPSPAYFDVDPEFLSIYSK
jgi:putative glycosyltransferase (TIGR04372 family)